MTHLNDLSKVYLENVAESAVPGKPAERLGAVTAIPKSEQDAARERILAKTKAKREAMKTEALDPVGQEDSDIDNDGDTDKTDKYLHNRRKAIGKAIAKNRKKDVKEGFSNWRQDLSEVMDDSVSDEKIKEKKVNNKIKINPKLGEAVEEIGATLLEMVEVDEFDFIVEGVYLELLDEGYDEEEIEEALEFALTEAKVTFGHDTASTEKKKEGLLGAARKRLSGVKTAAKAAVARGARKVAKGALGVARKMEGGDKAPKTVERKPSTYRGAGAGTKERVSSGSYTPPAKKKAEKPSDPWAGSATTPPKAKAKKAAAPKAKAPAKKKKSGNLDNLLASIRNEETSVERIDRISKEKVAQRAASAKKERESKASSAAAFQAHKKEVLAKGGRPVDALDSWQKMQMKKEEVQIDEKTLTKMEMKKREEIVKSMKDKKDDFERRYPGRGKEVMYATATKMAKKMAESITDQTPLTPQELQKQKQKAMLDTQISQLRKTALSKTRITDKAV